MTMPEIWPALLGPLKVNLKSIARSLIWGFAASLFAMPAQLAWEYAALFSQASWLRDFGFPIAWVGILKTSGTSAFPNLHFYFYWSSFIQNWLFWAAVFFALLFMWSTLHGEPPFALLPVYVVAISWARIQLEFQMAVAALGPISRFAQINPFSYAHIAGYFATALLLFPALVTLVSRLPFREIFKLSTLGFPIILMPPFVDYYVLRRPVVYNFFQPEFYQGIDSPLKYLTIASPGLKLEMALVASLTLAYLIYRTRSLVRPVVTVAAAVLVFAVVTTPVLTDQLSLSFSQPQLFAGYLVLTYLLLIVTLGLADKKTVSTILKRIRLRGIHFPAMALFGSFLVHPRILATNFLDDLGLIIAATLIVFLEWQTATVFDDIYDRGEGRVMPGYLAYGLLTGVTAVFSAIAFGILPFVLTILGVYLVIDYPRLRRMHFLLSGVLIGIGSAISFLFGTTIPIISQATAQPVGGIALGLFAVFSGGSLLKDIATVEEDKRSGVDTAFTKFEMKKVLPIVATFIAAGCALPILFLNAAIDLILILAMVTSAWIVVVVMKEKSYKPILLLYLVEGFWVFIRLFAVRPS